MSQDPLHRGEAGRSKRVEEGGTQSLGREERNTAGWLCNARVPLTGNDLELTEALLRVIGGFAPITLTFRCRLREGG